MNSPPPLMKSVSGTASGSLRSLDRMDTIQKIERSMRTSETLRASPSHSLRRSISRRRTASSGIFAKKVVWKNAKMGGRRKKITFCFLKNKKKYLFFFDNCFVFVLECEVCILCVCVLQGINSPASNQKRTKREQAGGREQVKVVMKGGGGEKLMLLWTEHAMRGEDGKYGAELLLIVGARSANRR